MPLAYSDNNLFLNKIESFRSVRSFSAGSVHKHFGKRWRQVFGCDPIDLCRTFDFFFVLSMKNGQPLNSLYVFVAAFHK